MISTIIVSITLVKKCVGMQSIIRKHQTVIIVPHNNLVNVL